MGKIKKGYKQTDIGVIPEDWEVKSLEFLSEKNMVGIASSATYAYRETGIVMFRNQNIKPNFLDDSDVIFLDPDYELIFKNKRLKKGDLLTARTGYPGTTCIVTEKYEGAQSFTTLISRIKNEAINKDYLCFYINSEYGQSFFEQNKIGGGQKNVNAGTLKLMPIPIPPSISEQTAIAAALIDVDTLIAALNKKITKKQQIKQGAMQQLLTGKKRLPGFSGDWVEKKLGDCFNKVIGGGTPSRSVPEYWNGNIPWATVKDFASFNPKFTQENITSLGLHNSASHLIPKETPITSTRMGLGKIMIYSVDVAINQDMKALFISEDYEKNYIIQWFVFSQEKIELMGTGSTVKGIRLEQLNDLEIYLPPKKSEQTAIAQILTDMDNEISQLEADRNKYEQIKAGMMQQLLTGKIRLVEN